MSSKKTDATVRREIAWFIVLWLGVQLRSVVPRALVTWRAGHDGRHLLYGN